MRFLHVSNIGVLVRFGQTCAARMPLWFVQCWSGGVFLSLLAAAISATPAVEMRHDICFSHNAGRVLPKLTTLTHADLKVGEVLGFASSPGEPATIAALSELPALLSLRLDAGCDRDGLDKASWQAMARPGFLSCSRCAWFAGAPLNMTFMPSKHQQPLLSWCVLRSEFRAAGKRLDCWRMSLKVL